MTTEKSLLEFMEEAELDHYYQALKDQLKINAIHQLKYVEEEDLNDIGMTKPEMRRLKKMYKKEFPAGALGKLKKAILTRSGGDIGRSLSPSPPEQRSPRPSSYIRPPCKQIIPANSIQINKTLGEGEFGIVQQGLWTTETGEKVQVAIKCLTKEKMHTGTTEFLKEANIMQNVDHENIVRMYGVVLDKDDSLMLVTELAPMRSLLECLKEQSLRTDFPLPRLCDFAQEICDGMSYLESKRLIHRDLAARNILVFSKSKVKISDFGLSRALGIGKDYYQSNFSLNLKLPIAWCAPECINYLKFTSASDIWAFGVTLWEIFTYGFQPWAGLTGQQILESIDAPNCQRLERPDLCPKEYYQIMTKCWEHDPERRPLFSELFVMLPQMRPTQVKAMKDFPEVVVPKDFLYYKSYDVIYVLDKNPEDCPKSGFWKGVLGNGKCGYFDPANVMPIIEHKNSPSVSKSISRKESKRENGDAKIKLSRKESKRESGSSFFSNIRLSRKESDKKEKSPKKGGKKESNRKSLRRFNAEMISGPQNDLRHTGHIGYDGAIFGDVGFIGDNYDKLPVKVASTGKEGESRISTVSLNRDENGHNMNGSLGTNGHSWISQESIDSQYVTRTDEVDSGDFQYQDIDDDSIFADFKMPDMSSSFDFGPSFMDEVLKAINDKEAKLANSSSNDSSATTTPQHESPPKLMTNGRGSKSPPPPLPVQPPRLEPRNREPPKPEPRKQAKVKPMSASDEKMIDDAIAMANELSSRSHMSSSQEPSSPDKYQSDSESDSGSPQNGSRFKFSFKRSPKLDRQRTFSEEIKNKADQVESVPPGAMEAYNQLVMRGSVKEKSGTSYSSEEREVTPPKREVTPVKRELTPVRREITPAKREIIPAKRDITPAKREITPAKREITPMKREVTPERREVTPVHQDSTYGVPLAMIDDFDLEPPEMNFNQLTEMSYHQKPVPKPRPDSKRSDIPIPAPKPRPEIIQRVEPVPRPQKPPPEIPQEYDLKVKLPEDEYRPKILDTSSEQTSECDSEDIKNNVEVLRIDEPDSDNVHTDSGTESVNSATEVNRQDDSRRDSYNKSSSLFVGEDFSEPSPREIMNKLARESRIRRSLDHQRGVISGSEEGHSRNIREPQGIPGKGAMSSSTGGDEDVETNPLRMLRGGAIPIRGGRVGQGMNHKTYNSKLHVKIPTLHHSMSVDSGTIQHVKERDATNLPSPTRAPAIPPRSNSVSGDGNSLPLPPRMPLRHSTPIGAKRERKFPLQIDDSGIDGHSTPQSLVRNYAWSESSKLTQHERTLPPAPPPPLKKHQIDDKPFDSGLDEDDDVFEGHDITPPSTLKIDTSSKSSTFPRVKFQFQKVKCNLEQLGFYNRKDPFWVKTLTLAGRNISDRGSSEEVSPLMLANYKTSEGVSYEDLLDFAFDREKNCEEVEMMRSVFKNEISVEDCQQALTETKWIVPMAIKYVKLKQLLSAQLGDITLCKEALMACDWDVQRAANHVLSNLSSPEIIDV
ncbi:uncharacterized protein LOC143056612 isoform X18 [Mytilus galloprovincialis]|uniref:uncharacterized protein LOC143056612 isoform X18 n=1 Tax=Mytilus galloprovincialis TaxID=29158 RepID=UPI003F7B52F4